MESSISHLETIFSWRNSWDAELVLTVEQDSTSVISNGKGFII